MSTAMPRDGCRVEATPTGGNLLASRPAAASANSASLTSSSRLWTATAGSAPATQAVKPWVSGSCRSCDAEVNGLYLQLSSCRCCRQFCAELYSVGRKKPRGMCFPGCRWLCSNSIQLSSGMFSWFQPRLLTSIRNDSPDRLKHCCFYVLGKKIKNLNVKHIWSLQWSR